MSWKKYSSRRLKLILKNNKIAMKSWFFFNTSKESNDAYKKENQEIEAELKRRRNENKR